MKNRFQTNESIRKKSAKILEARAARRRAAISAACVMLAFMTAGAFWLQHIQEMSDDIQGLSKIKTAPPSESDCFTRNENINKVSEAFGIKGIGDIYMSDTPIAETDSIRIYTKPASREVNLCADDSVQKQYIVRLNNWISTLKINEVSESKDSSDTVYVVEQSFGGNITSVYVKGNRIKFDTGRWFEFSNDDREKFDSIIASVFETR